MKTDGIIAVAAVAGLVIAAGCAKKEAAKETAAPAAQAAAPAQAFRVEAPDSLSALARVSVDSAAKLATAHVPGGVIQTAELEREKGALNWSFDLTVPGQEGISEVNVNALTGAVLPIEHEAAEATAPKTPQRAMPVRHRAAATTKRP